MEATVKHFFLFRLSNELQETSFATFTSHWTFFSRATLFAADYWPSR